jgi:L-lactate dehydrogenase complex protein LldE
MVKVLEKAGCQVHYNPNGTCCGQPAFNAGHWEESREVGEKFLSTFNDDEYIVSGSGSCTGFVRNYLPRVLAESPGSQQASLKNKRFFEFTEFMTDILNVVDLHARFDGVASYHDSCGALRECNVKEAPRKLLSKVSGLELIETDDCQVCCGFGGTFAVKFESISVSMAEQKVRNAINAGAEYIISTDLSCLLHMEGYIKKNKLGIKTIHIVDVLASGW